jgi:diguanylate cyclase (GGDEF)-like protein
MGTSAPSSSLWSDVPDATAVPLIVRRRVIGALAVTHAGPDGLDWSRRQTLTDFARVAAAGLVAACQYEEAVRQAIADPLTGLLNRTGFDRRLREELDRNHRTTKIGGALVVMDLDNFKHVNDTWGHLVGDAVVRIVAHDAIRSQIRSYDVPCRIGGDEFAVILPHTDLHHAVAVADRLRRAVADAPTDTVGVPRGTVGASLGVVSFTAGGVGPDDILDRADRIMYRAKRRGRNLVLADHTE